MSKIVQEVTKAFIESPYRNLWLNFPGMEVYVRKSHHMHPLEQRLIECFDVANVNVAPKFQGQGRFTTWIKEVESILQEYPDFEAIYVEMVLTQQFRDFFIKREWVVDKSAVSFYKFLK